MARQKKRNAFWLYAVISMQIYCPFPHELLVNAYITMSCKKINFIEAKLMLKKTYITVLLNYGGSLCKLFMVPMMNVTKIFVIRIMFLMLVNRSEKRFRTYLI